MVETNRRSRRAVLKGMSASLLGLGVGTAKGQQVGTNANTCDCGGTYPYKYSKEETETGYRDGEAVKGHLTSTVTEYAPEWRDRYDDWLTVMRLNNVGKRVYEGNVSDNYHNRIGKQKYTVTYPSQSNTSLVSKDMSSYYGAKEFTNSEYTWGDAVQDVLEFTASQCPYLGTAYSTSKFMSAVSDKLDGTGTIERVWDYQADASMRDEVSTYLMLDAQMKAGSQMTIDIRDKLFSAINRGQDVTFSISLSAPTYTMSDMTKMTSSELNQAGIERVTPQKLRSKDFMARKGNVPATMSPRALQAVQNGETVYVAYGHKQRQGRGKQK